MAISPNKNIPISKKEKKRINRFEKYIDSRLKNLLVKKKVKIDLNLFFTNKLSAEGIQELKSKYINAGWSKVDIMVTKKELVFGEWWEKPEYAHYDIKSEKHPYLNDTGAIFEIESIFLYN